VPAVNGSHLRRFGLFEVDLRAGELRRNGSKLKLQEQPFQVLAVLLETPGEVVSREELQNRLWPADTFVDFDHSLNAAIKRLRDALGDSAENPRFVETVSRRGYRFVAPVNGGSAIASEPSEAITTRAEAAPKLKKHFRLWWAAASALLLFGLILGLVRWGEHNPQPRLTQLTANPSDDRVHAAAISPDGKYLAFSDETGFYLRQIGTGETHLIAVPTEFGVRGVSWFPDSVHMVLSLVKGGERPSLWDLSILNGAVRRINDDGSSPAVSPDGTQVAFLKGAKMRQQLWLMGSNGGEPRKLVGEEGDYFGSIAWSPNGDRIAYTKGRLSHGYGVQAVIEVMELSGYHITSLLSQPGLDLPLAWTSRDRLIYSLSELRPRQADSNLWWVELNRQGQIRGSPSRLTSDSGEVAGISTSADGKRVMYLKGVLQPDVYVAKLENDGVHIGEPQRLTLDDRRDFPYDWTADGKSVIFISDRTGAFNIYQQAIDQTVPVLLVEGNETHMLARLSPDGSQLLYLSYPNAGQAESKTSLMRLSLSSGAPQRALEPKSIGNHQCARLPSTVCIYSELGQGILTFFTYDPFRGQGPQVFQIKDDVPVSYNWSLAPNGDMLAIAKGKGGDEPPNIRLVSLNGGGERWLRLANQPGLTSLDWAADGKSLWASSTWDEGNTLLNIDLQGRVREVWRPKRMTVGWAIPSRDGRYLALQVGSGSANAWMLSF
jgi:Tol biopolymer transport system component/DNA-binding winged helix-turn-helix (wHTH) protein